MSMLRTEALAYINGTYSVAIAEAGRLTTDAAGGLKYVLDKAQRAQGIAPSSFTTATVGDSDEEDFIKRLDYYALEQLARDLASHVNISKSVAGQSASKARQQMYEHVVQMRDAAKLELVDLGAWSSGYFNLDTLEPLLV